MNQNKEIYVLITGTRNPLTDIHKQIIRKEMEYINDLKKGDTLILVHGDCSGVDRYGAEIAKSLGWKIIAVPAQWNLYGKSAGPKRNQLLLDTYMPHIALAFPAPDSKGTIDCIRRIEKYRKSSMNRMEYMKQILLM
jgi:hypothetical protein